MLPLLAGLLLSAPLHAEAPHHSILWYFSSGLMEAGSPRPILAYVDDLGNPADWLFDSLILYDIRLYHYGGHPTAGDVDLYFEHLFEAGQLALLADEVGRLKEELQDPDYRLQVYLSVPWLPDVPVATYVDALLAGWEASAVDAHLELAGFYYGSEEAACDTGVVDRIAETATAVHERGQSLVWIPYNNACGYADWATMGFDRASLQPNYAFTDADESLFTEVADRIHRADMAGNEMEFGGVRNTEIPDTDTELYSALAYLRNADAQNWTVNDWVSWYYTVPVVNYATSPGKRVVYDGIYRFISGRPRRSVARRLRVPASADAFVQNAPGYEDTVDGSDRLNLGSNSFPNNLRVYVGFDLAGQDLSGRLLSAHLYLTQRSFPYGDDLSDAELWLMDPDAWSEESLTWRTQPSSTLGAHLSDHRFRAEPLYPQLHALDVSEAVEDLLERGKTRVSFMLRRTSEDGSLAEVTLYSREQGDETAPTLQFVFEPAPPSPDTGLDDDSGEPDSPCEPCESCEDTGCPDETPCRKSLSDEGACGCASTRLSAWGALLSLAALLRRRRSGPGHRLHGSYEGA